MVINHNIAALNTYNKLNANQKATTSSLEKLSSGLRITKAGDDAAGLAISQKMQAQINGLDQASSNAQNGISLVQTAEGALSETQSILQRMSTLVTQASNGTLADTDRSNITIEIGQLNNEIDRISTSTQFNGKALLDGSFGVQLDATTSGIKVGSNGVTAINISGAKESSTYTIGVTTAAGKDTYTLTDTTGGAGTQIVEADVLSAGVINFDKFGVSLTVNGAQTATGLSTAATVITGASDEVNLQIGSNNKTYDQLGLSIGKMDKSAGSLNTASIVVTSAASSATAIDTVTAAIDTVSAQRASLGAYQNRLDHTINNLEVSSQNLTSASAQITDVDMAKEMTNFTKNNILTQAAQAMLAQANQLPQGVLSLLK